MPAVGMAYKRRAGKLKTVPSITPSSKMRSCQGCRERKVRGEPCVWIGVAPASKEGYTPAALSAAKEEIVRLNSLIDHLMCQLEDPTPSYRSPIAPSSFFDLSIIPVTLPKRRPVVQQAMGPSLESSRSSFLVDAEALLSFANSPTSPRRSQFALGTSSRSAGGDIVVAGGGMGATTAPTDPTIDATSSIVASSDAGRPSTGRTDDMYEMHEMYAMQGVQEKQASAYEERYDLAMTKLKEKARAKAALVG